MNSKMKSLNLLRGQQNAPSSVIHLLTLLIIVIDTNSRTMAKNKSKRSFLQVLRK